MKVQDLQISAPLRDQRPVREIAQRFIRLAVWYLATGLLITGLYLVYERGLSIELLLVFGGALIVGSALISADELIRMQRTIETLWANTMIRPKRRSDISSELREELAEHTTAQASELGFAIKVHNRYRIVLAQRFQLNEEGLRPDMTSEYSSIRDPRQITKTIEELARYVESIVQIAEDSEPEELRQVNTRLCIDQCKVLAEFALDQKQEAYIYGTLVMLLDRESNFAGMSSPL